MNTLKKIRLDKSLTVKEFADILGVSKSLIEKIESNNKKTSRVFLEKVKRIYPEIDLNIFFK